MPWWGWVLIGIGVVAIGTIKIAVFNRIRRNRASKKRFADDE
ncbi:MAG: hypothetical protein ACOYU3_02590 [Bacillota bacterium]